MKASMSAPTSPFLPRIIVKHGAQNVMEEETIHSKSLWGKTTHILMQTKDPDQVKRQVPHGLQDGSGRPAVCQSSFIMSHGFQIVELPRRERKERDQTSTPHHLIRAGMCPNFT